MRKCLLILAAGAMVACEKPFVADDDGDEPSVVVLADCPTPSVLITYHHYRLPTRL